MITVATSMQDVFSTNDARLFEPPGWKYMWCICQLAYLQLLRGPINLFKCVEFIGDAARAMHSSELYSLVFKSGIYASPEHGQ